MLSSAPVAFLCTRMSLDFASRVRGCRAPDLAIFALLSSCVAKLVMHPTALHWTSTLREFICLINGASPPSATIATLFSAASCQYIHPLCCYGDVVLFTARLPSAALAARCTSMSGFWRRNKIGSRVSRSTSLTSAIIALDESVRGVREECVPRSVISAKVRLADLCKSMLSEYTSVLNARSGSPEKKSVSARCEGGQFRMWDASAMDGVDTFSRKPKRSATASRSLSASTGS